MSQPYDVPLPFDDDLQDLLYNDIHDYVWEEEDEE